jgi:flagellar protein FliO/FliZ
MPRVRYFLLGLALGFGALMLRAADDSRVIYPVSSPAPGGTTAGATASGVGALTIFGAVALAAAGGWMLWRGRKLPFAGRELRKLAIDETRSLGSRQYLVVASYEGKKLLLGVCPGRIDLLTPLDAPANREPSR